MNICQRINPVIRHLWLNKKRQIKHENSIDFLSLGIYRVWLCGWEEVVRVREWMGSWALNTCSKWTAFFPKAFLAGDLEWMRLAHTLIFRVFHKPPSVSADLPMETKYSSILDYFKCWYWVISWLCRNSLTLDVLLLIYSFILLQ